MGPVPGMSKVMEHLRKRTQSRDALDLSQSMTGLEQRLTEQTHLIDEMKKVLPISVAAPGIIAIGGAGAGKSTILEALTNVPMARGTQGIRRPVHLKIAADPTCTKEYALVSGTDPRLKEDTRRVDSLDPELPRCLLMVAEEGALHDFIYVRVVRPSGPTYSVIDFPALASPPTEEQAALLRRILLEEDTDRLILAVLPVTDVFERPDAVLMAKKLDPESKRTIGVVTKMQLLTKEMGVVEKLQVTSNKALVLPLGYVAVCAAVPHNASASKPTVLAYERQFFSSNPLLKGLRPERWGLPSLKRLVINCQTNYIAHCIPTLSHHVRGKIEAMASETERSGRDFRTAVGGQAHFDSPTEFFSKLCSEVTSVAFDINELANGSITRQDRKFNLGPRFLHAMEAREAEARRELPHCLSPQVAQWLTRELDEFRGVVTNSDSMMHPIFRKAVRELCFPVLRVYAACVIEDTNSILREVMNALVDERFGDYSRLVEALKRDVAQTQARKRVEAETLIGRLLESELNWIFANDVDLQRVQKEVELGLQQLAAGGPGGAERKPRSVEAELWGEEDEVEIPEEATEGAGLGISRSGKPLLQSEDSRELRAMQLALHAYVRLLLRRMFYAVPMNVRNVMMNEFRQDIVALVVTQYNNADRLRTLLHEEMWLNHKRKQRGEQQAALEDVLRKLDLLSS